MEPLYKFVGPEDEEQEQATAPVSSGASANPNANKSVVGEPNLKFTSGDAQEDLIYDKEFQQAARVYYNRLGNPYTRANKYSRPSQFDQTYEEPMAEFKTEDEKSAAVKMETDEDYAKAFVWDFRRADANTMAMVSQLVDAKAANKDPELANAFSTLKKTWEDYPYFWQEGGGGAEAFVENVKEVMKDPVTWVSAGVGAALSKGALLAKAIHGFSTNAVIDFTAGTMFNLASQNRDVELLGGEVSNTEAVLAGAVSAAIPAGIAGTLAGTRWAAKKTYGVYKGFTTEGLEDVLSQESKELLGSNLTKEAADAEKKAFGAIDIATGQAPHEIVDAKTGKAAIDPATGLPIVAPSRTAAQRAAKAANATSTTGQSFTFREKRFKTPDEAKTWAASNGPTLYGGNNVGVTNLGLTPKGATPTLVTRRSRINEAFTSAVQTWLHGFKSIEDVAPELQAAAKARVAAGAVTPQDIGFVDTVDLSKQFNLTMNKERVAEDFLIEGPIMPVASAESPGLLEYASVPNAKGFFDILYDGMNDAGSANIGASGKRYNTDNYRRDLGTYLMATRVENYEAANATRGGAGQPPKLSLSVNTQAFLDFKRDLQTNAPEVAAAFDRTMEQMIQFNDHLLEFAIQHDILTREAAAKMRGVSGIFVPLRHVIDGKGHDARLSLVPSSPGPSTLRKGVREDAAAEDLFVDPIQSYEDMVQIVIKAAMINRTKAQVYRQIMAAGPTIANQIIEEVKQPPGKANVSLANLEKALQAHGVNVSFASNPNVAPYMAIYFRTSDFIGQKLQGRDFVWINGELKEFAFKDKLIGDALLHYGKFYGTSLADMFGVEGKVGRGALSPLQFWRDWNKLTEKMVVNWAPVNTMILAPADSVSAAILNPRLNWRNLPVVNMLYGYGKHIASNFTKDSARAQAIINGGLLSGRSGAMSSLMKLDPAMAWAAKNGIDPSTIGGISREVDMKLMDRLMARARVALSENAILRMNRAITDASESATRQGSYGAAIASGTSVAQASLDASRYSVNFRLKGNSELATFILDSMLFMRSTAQATYQVASMVTKKGNRASVLSRLALFTLAPTVALELINQKDDYYNSLTDQEKDMFWFIPIREENGTIDYIRYRKPQQLSIPANVVRRYMQEMRKDEAGDMLLKIMASHFASATYNEFRFDENFYPGGPVGFAIGMAQGTTPLGTPLLPPGKEEAAPWAQLDHVGTGKFFSNRYMMDTIAEVEQATGGVVKLTPNMLEFLVTSTMGAFGTAAIDGLDMLDELSDGTITLNPERLFMLGKVYRSSDKARRYISSNEILKDISDNVGELTKAMSLANNDEKLANAILTYKQRWGDAAYEKAVQIQERLDAIEAKRQQFRTELNRLAGQTDKPPNFNAMVDGLYNTYTDLLYELVEKPRMAKIDGKDVKVGPSLRELFLDFKRLRYSGGPDKPPGTKKAATLNDQTRDALNASVNYDSASDSSDTYLSRPSITPISGLDETIRAGVASGPRDHSQSVKPDAYNKELTALFDKASVSKYKYLHDAEGKPIRPSKGTPKLHDALSIIARTSKDPGRAELAKKLLQVAPNIHVHKSWSRFGFTARGAVGYKNQKDQYGGTSNMMIFDGGLKAEDGVREDADSSGVNETTLLHESIHHIMNEHLANTNDLTSKSWYKDMDKVYRSFNTSMLTGDRYRNEHRPGLKAIDHINTFEGADASSSFDEFIARALTERQFQIALDDMVAKDGREEVEVSGPQPHKQGAGKTGWDKFVDAVGTMLGFGGGGVKLYKVHTALSDVLRARDDMFKEFNQNIEEGATQSQLNATTKGGGTGSNKEKTKSLSDQTKAALGAAAIAIGGMTTPTGQRKIAQAISRKGLFNGLRSAFSTAGDSSLPATIEQTEKAVTKQAPVPTDRLEGLVNPQLSRREALRGAASTMVPKGEILSKLANVTTPPEQTPKVAEPWRPTKLPDGSFLPLDILSSGGSHRLDIKDVDARFSIRDIKDIGHTLSGFTKRAAENFKKATGHLPTDVANMKAHGREAIDRTYKAFMPVIRVLQDATSEVDVRSKNYSPAKRDIYDYTMAMVREMMTPTESMYSRASGTARDIMKYMPNIMDEFANVGDYEKVNMPEFIDDLMDIPVSKHPHFRYHDMLLHTGEVVKKHLSPYLDEYGVRHVTDTLARITFNMTDTAGEGTKAWISGLFDSVNMLDVGDTEDELFRADLSLKLLKALEQMGQVRKSAVDEAEEAYTRLRPNILKKIEDAKARHKLHKHRAEVERQRGKFK